MSSMSHPVPLTHYLLMNYGADWLIDCSLLQWILHTNETVECVNGSSARHQRQWRIYGAFGDAPWCRTPYYYFTQNLHAQCMDVWCEAFCCRHIYFKTVFQSASKHAILIQKILKKIMRRGTAPSPDSTPEGGELPPVPYGRGSHPPVGTRPPHRHRPRPVAPLPKS